MVYVREVLECVHGVYERGSRVCTWCMIFFSFLTIEKTQLEHVASNRRETEKNVLKASWVFFGLINKEPNEIDLKWLIIIFL